MRQLMFKANQTSSIVNQQGALYESAEGATSPSAEHGIEKAVSLYFTYRRLRSSWPAWLPL